MSSSTSMNFHPRYKDLFIITTRTIVDQTEYNQYKTKLDSSTTLTFSIDNIIPFKPSQNVKYEKKVEIVYNVLTGLSYTTTSYNILN